MYNKIEHFLSSELIILFFIFFDLLGINFKNCIYHLTKNRFMRDLFKKLFKIIVIFFVYTKKLIQCWYRNMRLQKLHNPNVHTDSNHSWILCTEILHTNDILINEHRPILMIRRTLSRSNCNFCKKIFGN